MVDDEAAGEKWSWSAMMDKKFTDRFRLQQYAEVG